MLLEGIAITIVGAATPIVLAAIGELVAETAAELLELVGRDRRLRLR